MIIKQYNINNINNIGTPTNCKVGVSISEDDYFSYRPSKQHPYIEEGQQQPEIKQENDPYITLGTKNGFYFQLNGEPIYLGLTFKYQSDTFLDSASFSFPMQVPKSILIQILQKEKKEYGSN